MSSKLTFDCIDRFNEKHDLSKSIADDENKGYKNLIDSLNVFQTEVNTMMTGIVEREKAEIKEKPNISKKIESDEDEDIDEEEKTEDEIEIKKKKPN